MFLIGVFTATSYIATVCAMLLWVAASLVYLAIGMFPEFSYSD